MSAHPFEAILHDINNWTILRLPKSSSSDLPSRGMVMVTGFINNIPFQSPLEPDGSGSHWMRIPESLLKTAGIKSGDSVLVVVEPMEEWPEPEISPDFLGALETRQLLIKWQGLTTKAKWDWLRWIRSTKNPATRVKRIDVACSKLSAGDNRPCCFNRNTCTDTTVSKNGMLLKP